MTDNFSYDICELCLRKRNSFYCIQCVQNEDFTHSKDFKFPERYAEKKLRLYQIECVKQQLSTKIKQALEDQLVRDKIHRELIKTRNNVAIMKIVIAKVEVSLMHTKEKQAILQDECLAIRQRLNRYQQRSSIIRKDYKQMLKKMAEDQGGYDDFTSKIKTMCKNRIRDLQQHVFKVEEIRASNTSDNSLDRALAEATRNTYFKGHWIQHDPFGPHQYKIVNPTLPCSRDYSVCTLFDPDSFSKDIVWGMSDSSNFEMKSGYSIEAGLTYTAQLVNLLAFYLNVYLPYRLCYSEFCLKGLTAEQFASRVGKLNSNVLALCLTQHLPPAILNPKHTLQNVKSLLDSDHVFIGRDQVFDVDPNILYSFQESFIEDLGDDDLSDESDEVQTYNDEWEALDIPREAMSRMETTVSRNTRSNFASFFFRTGQS